MKKIDARSSETPDNGQRERTGAASDDAGIGDSRRDKIAPARGIVIGIALSAILWAVIWHLFL